MFRIQGTYLSSIKWSLKINSLQQNVCSNVFLAANPTVSVEHKPPPRPKSFSIQSGGLIPKYLPWPTPRPSSSFGTIPSKDKLPRQKQTGRKNITSSVEVKNRAIKYQVTKVRQIHFGRSWRSRGVRNLEKFTQVTRLKSNEEQRVSGLLTWGAEAVTQLTAVTERPNSHN